MGPRIGHSGDLRGRCLLTALAALTAGLLGCGDQSETSTAAPATEVAETPDRQAELPSGWSTVENQSAGFTVGLPPGWSAAPQEGGQGTVLTSPDDLAAVTISADRSAGAMAIEPAEFAKRTMSALASDHAGEGGLSEVDAARTVPFEHLYEGAVTTGTGVGTASGARELVAVTVLRRPELAVYVVVSRGNAERASEFSSAGTITEIAASLRGQPPG